ncbi:MAG: hypothetical protein GKR92_03850 [Gammaproteobacteria bacterium]|nr:MAG: hypothetical protein GKR92_03850 [Gammaproteobacteria bacterium]
MNQSAATKDERRIARRKTSPTNLRLYCPQLNLTRCRPTNLSTRGAFLDSVPEHAYVGRRVQLVFSVSEANAIKLIRVWAVVVHLSNEGIGFGFTHKYRAEQSANH